MMIRADCLEDRTDEQFVLELLEETGLLVVHGSGFGCDVHAGYFRLVYLADEEVLAGAFSGIRRFVEKQRSEGRGRNAEVRG
jgi:alanine-synthesizing transaminase